MLKAYLERVDRFNPALNALVVDDRRSAMNRARAADRALAKGELWGPLHGLPMTVKECFDLVGQPTTWGHLPRKDHAAATDALAVDRLKAAGAVVFGKSNVPLNLADFQSYNAVYGTTHNPWDLTRGPGGSSGGSAAHDGRGPERAGIRQRHRRQHPQPGGLLRRVRPQVAPGASCPSAATAWRPSPAPRPTCR